MRITRQHLYRLQYQMPSLNLLVVMGGFASGEGWTLTGITSIDEHTSVMFDGVRYTLPAREIVEVL